jgi:hypothetical protein
VSRETTPRTKQREIITGKYLLTLQSAALKKMLKGKPQSKRHLVYNPHMLCTWEIFFHISGTVFNDRKIWKVAACLVGTSTLIGCIVWACVPNPHDLKMSPFFEVVRYFKVFIAFMLGMYMSSCLKRWWACMQSLTDFFLGIRRISWFMHAAAADLECVEAVQRLAIVSAYLLENEVTSIWVNQVQTRDELWEALVEHLLSDGHIHPDEVDTLELFVEHDNRALVVWSWIGIHVSKLKVPPPVKSMLYGFVSAQTDIVTQIKNYLLFQLPYMYSHMLACFVHINNILIAVACGVGIAVAVADLVKGYHHWDVKHDGHTLPDGTDPRAIVYSAFQAIFAQLLVLFTQPLIYQAFLEIASTLNDPFTHQVYGLPLHECIDELRTQLKEQSALAVMDLDTMEKDVRKSYLKGVMRSATRPTGDKSPYSPS